MTDDNDALLADLRHICGQRRALTVVSGRWSASTAALLRNIRNNRLFRPLLSSWEEFCACRIHVSRRHADRIMALLDEFGPASFELAELNSPHRDIHRQARRTRTPAPPNLIATDPPHRRSDCD